MKLWFFCFALSVSSPSLATVLLSDIKLIIEIQLLISNLASFKQMAFSSSLEFSHSEGQISGPVPTAHQSQHPLPSQFPPSLPLSSLSLPLPSFPLPFFSLPSRREAAPLKPARRSGGALFCCIVYSQNAYGCSISGSLVSIAMSGKMKANPGSGRIWNLLVTYASER